MNRSELEIFVGLYAFMKRRRKIEGFESVWKIARAFEMRSDPSQCVMRILTWMLTHKLLRINRAGRIVWNDAELE